MTMKKNHNNRPAKKGFVGSVVDLVAVSGVRVMHSLASLIHKTSNGKVHPNDITFVLLLAHVLIALLIAKNYLLIAGLLLLLTSIFSALDGELARLQKTVSDRGGMFEAVAERMQELMIYLGIVYLLAGNGLSGWVYVVTLLACGASLVMPYVRAKGEAIISTYGHELPYKTLQRIYSGSFAPYALRISLTSVGLIVGIDLLPWFILLTAIITSLALLERIYIIMRHLR